jgi:hypothetical protein
MINVAFGFFACDIFKDSFSLVTVSRLILISFGYICFVICLSDICQYFGDIYENGVNEF